jgi:hypothetical protein
MDMDFLQGMSGMSAEDLMKMLENAKAMERLEEIVRVGTTKDFCEGMGDLISLIELDFMGVTDIANIFERSVLDRMAMIAGKFDTPADALKALESKQSE